MATREYCTGKKGVWVPVHSEIAGRLECETCGGYVLPNRDGTLRKHIKGSNNLGG